MHMLQPVQNKVCVLWIWVLLGEPLGFQADSSWSYVIPFPMKGKEESQAELKAWSNEKNDILTSVIAEDIDKTQLKKPINNSAKISKMRS